MANDVWGFSLSASRATANQDILPSVLEVVNNRMSFGNLDGIVKSSWKPVSTSAPSQKQIF